MNQAAFKPLSRLSKRQTEQETDGKPNTTCSKNMILPSAVPCCELTSAGLLTFSKKGRH